MDLEYIAIISSKSHHVDNKKNVPVNKEILKRIKIALGGMALVASFGIGLGVGNNYGKNEENESLTKIAQNEASLEAIRYDNALNEYIRMAEKILDANKYELGVVSHTLTSETSETYHDENVYGYNHQGIAGAIKVYRASSEVDYSKYLIAGLYEAMPLLSYENLDKVIRCLDGISLEDYCHSLGYQDMDEFISLVKEELMVKNIGGLAR